MHFAVACAKYENYVQSWSQKIKIVIKYLMKTNKKFVMFFEYCAINIY